MMETKYGVAVPRGVRKDWDCSSMDAASGGHVLRKYHADPMWDDPKRCVAWFDRFDRVRVIVGHYWNGRSAVVRINANGGWSATFDRAPVEADNHA
jgi:hypothetical protein